MKLELDLTPQQKREVCESNLSFLFEFQFPPMAKVHWIAREVKEGRARSISEGMEKYWEQTKVFLNIIDRKEVK